MSATTDFIKNAILQKPIDAKANFDVLMDDAIAAKIEQGYDEYKLNFFKEPEESENTDVE